MSRPRDIADKATAESRAKGGRAKAEKIHASKEEARQHYLEHLGGVMSPALERLSALVDSEDERVAIRAVVEILDRLFGRPTQQLAHLSGEPIEVRLAFDPRP